MSLDTTSITDHTALMAISPLDGRYRDKLIDLQALFSEYGLMRLRVQVEVRWLIMLSQHGNLPECPPLSQSAQHILQNISDNFSLADAARIKHIESGINHDVKAVEYFLKERTSGNAELASVREFIHFGCTSEDINNLSYGLMLLTARQQFILPALDDLLGQLRPLAHRFASTAMLARTHGQPATPTTIGKEIANVVARLQRQMMQLAALTVAGKLNGASGNYNALIVACPETHWQVLSKNFVDSLGLQWNPYTTQIEPHDSMAEYFAILMRINTILIDFCRDIWGYIALNYFHQKTLATEVGSSIMPHKVNPIDFENAEGNLGIANALLDHMAQKLPVSRWQRDLSDSTVLRNMGVAIAHGLLAFTSINRGLTRIEPNTALLSSELDQHWEILAEPIQTLLRRHGVENAYEKLKDLTRGKTITRDALHTFINTLPLPATAREALCKLTPASYTGLAEELAKRI